MSIFGGDSGRGQHSDPSPSASPISPTRESPTSSAVYDGRATDEDEFLGWIKPLTDTSEEDENDELLAEGETRDRFRGSDQQWRYHTKDETALSRSLFELRANDLSAHLYNAHAWKSRAYSRDSDLSFFQTHRKSAWTSAGDRRSGSTWTPDTRWTAWPLEPNSVPPSDMSFWQQKIRPGPQAPGKELLEELEATAMGIIKRQWNERPEPQIDRQSSHYSQSRNGSASKSPSEPTSSPEQSDDESDAGVDSHGPIISADDARSSALLRPIINSTMSHLDKLLLALHHNRAGQYALGKDEEARALRANSMSRSRSNSAIRRWRHRRASSVAGGSQEEDSRSGVGSPPSKRLKTGEETSISEAARGRQRRRSSSVSSSSSGNSSDNDQRNRAPRDWSEVLGLAALIGWDPAAIEKTKLRCAQLFGEDMILTTTPETPAAEPSHARLAVIETSDVEIVEAELDSRSNPLITTDGYLCPEPDCPTHAAVFPFSRAYRLREHVRRVHRYNDEQVRQLEHELGLDKGRSQLALRNPRGWEPPDPLKCPIKGCPAADKVWPEVRRLIGHLQRYHKYDPRTESPPPGIDVGGPHEAE